MFQKLYWPFTFQINCSSDIKKNKILGLQPRISNFFLIIRTILETNTFVEIPSISCIGMICNFVKMNLIFTWKTTNFKILSTDWFSCEWGKRYTKQTYGCQHRMGSIRQSGIVINPKYYKHWLYTLASTIDVYPSIFNPKKYIFKPK